MPAPLSPANGPPPAVLPAKPSPADASATGTATAAACDPVFTAAARPTDSDPRFWGSAEYLFYFLKPTPGAGPIATTGPVAGRGILGNPVGPGRVILGLNHTDYGMFNGMQYTLGGWLNRDHTIGVEGSAFLLENRVQRDSLTGGPNGFSVLGRPFYDTTIGANNTRLLALPGAFDGSIHTKSEARFWGAELHGLGRLMANDGFTLDSLAGFRFLSLEESYTITDNVNVLGGGITAFNGVGLPGPVSTSATDRFATQNRFYGGTMGLRAGYTGGVVMLNVTGKVSLGSVHEVVALSGESTLAGGPNPLPSTVPGGLYNLTTNIGRYKKDTFAAVPEVNFRAGIRVTSHLTITGGYNFLYLSRVVRPTEQINETVNPTFLPTSPTLGVPFGPRQPSFNMTQTDFWVHGATVGLALTY